MTLRQRDGKSSRQEICGDGEESDDMATAPNEASDDGGYSGVMTPPSLYAASSVYSEFHGTYTPAASSVGPLGDINPSRRRQHKFKPSTAQRRVVLSHSPQPRTSNTGNTATGTNSFPQNTALASRNSPRNLKEPPIAESGGEFDQLNETAKLEEQLEEINTLNAERLLQERLVREQRTARVAEYNWQGGTESEKGKHCVECW